MTSKKHTVLQLSSPWPVPANLLNSLTWNVLFLVGCLFPNGRFVPRWTRWVAVIWLWGPLYLFFALFPLFIVLSNIVWFGGLACLVVALIYRYRVISTPMQRQQTRWIVFGWSAIFLLTIVWNLPPLLFPSFAGPGTLFDLALAVYMTFFFVPGIPCVAIAVLRYRLFDIDLIINRTLVYGILTVCVVGLYVLVVGYLGALFGASGNLLISLVATGLVAVLFQPLRAFLQRGVNRLLYGQRDEPYTVITQLSQRLEVTLAPDAVLSTIVKTVAQALKLPYVGSRHFYPAASPLSRRKFVQQM